MEGDNKNKIEYVSLQKASEYCCYSQDYLKLRARQGKLRAVKIGRNWVTKKEWVEEYLKKVEEYRNYRNNQKPAEEETTLPIHQISDKGFNLNPTPIFLALGFVLLLGSAIWVKDSFFPLRDFALSVGIRYRQQVEEQIGAVVRESRLLSQEIVQRAGQAQYLAAPTSSVFKEYFQWLSNEIAEESREIKSGLARQTFAVAQEIKKAPQIIKLLKSDFNRLLCFVEKKTKSFSFNLPEITMPQIEMPKISMPKMPEKLSQLPHSFAVKAMECKQAIKNTLSESARKIETAVSQKTEALKTAISKIPDRASSRINQFVVRPVSEIPGQISDTTNQFLVEPIRGAYRFVVSPWEIEPPLGGPEIPTAPAEEKKEETAELEQNIAKLQAEIEQLKREGLPQKEIIKEVQKITKIEPVKEIIKEVIKVDQESLTKVKGQIQVLEKELAKKYSNLETRYAQLETRASQALYYPQISYMTPSLPYQNVQTGNVSLSAGNLLEFTGNSIKISGDTRVLGSLSVGAATLTIDSSGNLSTSGGITTTGTLTVKEIHTTERIITQQSLRITPLSAAPASPEQGEVYYDLLANKIYVWANNAWVDLTSQGTTQLAGLTTDVTIATPANSQLLKYNSTSSKWENWSPDYSTLAGTETLTNKTLTTPIIASLYQDAGKTKLLTLPAVTGTLEVTGHIHAAGDITSGSLVHERGGLEADVSAYDGLLKISGGATSSITDSSINWNTAYAYSQVGHLPLAGGQMTGNITFSGAQTVDGVDISTIPSTYLALAGGTLTGDLLIQKTGDAKLTIHSNTDSPTGDALLLELKTGLTTPTTKFSIDEDGDVVVAGGLDVTGTIKEGGTALSSKYIGIPGSSAQGDILIRDGSGWTRLAAGNSGEYLKSQGSGANPVWAALSLTASNITETWAGTVQQAITNLRQMTAQVRPIAQVLDAVDETSYSSIEKSGNNYVLTAAATSGNVLTDVISSDSKLLLYFKSLKLAISNGGSTHATPVQAEIYGNADSYATALNGTTKFTINPSSPLIELKRKDITEAATGANQTDWTMTAAGCFPAVAGDKYETILAQEVGVAAVLVVEKSVLGTFADTVVLEGGTDYTVDYSTRTATKITLSSSAASDITTSSKLRITWVADIMKIDNSNTNTSLKLKIYLNRTNTGETSPNIQPVATGKYTELLYEYTSKPMLTEKDILQQNIETLTMAKTINDAMAAGVSANDIATQINTAISNGSKTAADIAGIFENTELTAANAASIFNSANFTVANAGLVVDNANLTAGRGASIFDNANLTAAKGASIFDNANLTTTRISAILASANISSAKISSIFNTGSLSVDAKRAAVLDGAQYLAATAATDVNAATYTVAQKALAYDNAALTAARAASITDSANLTATNAALIFDHANLTAAKAASIFDNANLTTTRISAILADAGITSAKISSIFNTGSLSVDAKRAAVLDGAQYLAATAATDVNAATYTVAQKALAFDNAALTAARAASITDSANLTAANAALIFDNANLTAAKLISILDNANITSAKIKSIFETGSLTVDAKRAAVLEGDQYAAADAATSCEGAFYTVAQLALAFDNANLTAAKGASIWAHANLTDAKLASILEHANLTITKINSIIIHDNISDSKAQERLNATSYANRDLTGAASILYAIHDDWIDNKLTSRDNRATTPADVLGANEFAQKFRPEWTTVAGTPTATGGELVLDALNEEVSIPSTFVTGAWELNGRHSAYNVDQGCMQFYPMYVDATHYYRLWHWGTPGSTDFRLGVNSGAGEGEVCGIGCDLGPGNATWKITRDTSGNFSIWYAGACNMTGTNTGVTTSAQIHIKATNATLYIDWLKVY